MYRSPTPTASTDPPRASLGFSRCEAQGNQLSARRSGVARPSSSWVAKTSARPSQGRDEGLVIPLASLRTLSRHACHCSLLPSWRGEGEEEYQVC
jgi:hypothetical protein